MKFVDPDPYPDWAKMLDHLILSGLPPFSTRNWSMSKTIFLGLLDVSAKKEKEG
jgi:hypothetical protein